MAERDNRVQKALHPASIDLPSSPESMPPVPPDHRKVESPPTQCHAAPRSPPAQAQSDRPSSCSARLAGTVQADQGICLRIDPPYALCRLPWTISSTGL